MNKALQVSLSALTVGLLALALHGAAHAADPVGFVVQVLMR